MSAEPSPYRIVRCSVDNIHLLPPLYAEAFGRREPTDYFIRKYTTRWTKDGQFCGHMALNEQGHCVAHHTAIPFLFQFGGREVLAAHSCDSVTAEEARGKGLFTILGKMTDELLQREGYQFIFGFSNENSLPAATKKLGWQYMENLNGYRIKVRTLPLEKICRRLRFPHALYLRWVDFTFRKALMQAPIPNSCIDGEDGGILRDEHFYRYRSFSFNRRTRINGVGIWWKLHAQLCIGDMERAPEEKVLAALKALRRRCWWLGITEIIFQASPGTYHERIFAKHYPAFKSWATLRSNFTSDVDFSRLKLTFGDIDSF